MGGGARAQRAASTHCWPHSHLGEAHTGGEGQSKRRSYSSPTPLSSSPLTCCPPTSYFSPHCHHKLSFAVGQPWSSTPCPRGHHPRLQPPRVSLPHPTAGQHQAGPPPGCCSGFLTLPFAPPPAPTLGAEISLQGPGRGTAAQCRHSSDPCSARQGLQQVLWGYRGVGGCLWVNGGGAHTWLKAS